jgi:hypothetical protein
MPLLTILAGIPDRYSMSLDLKQQYLNQIEAIRAENPQAAMDKASLQIALDKLTRFYENCNIAIRNNQPCDKDLLASFEYEFKSLLVKFGIPYKP